MSSFSSSFLLICGYIHRSDDDLSSPVPKVIIDLIDKFCPFSHLIFGVGKNMFGEFGIGHNRKVLKYQLLPDFSRLCFHHSDIYRLQGQYLIRSGSKNVYGINNKCFELQKFSKLSNDYHITEDGHWLPSKAKLESLFTRADHWFIIFHGCGKRIVQMQCGKDHTLFLTSDGRVYAWGSNIHGQCGDGNSKHSYLSKPKIIALEIIITIKAGHSHNLCIDKNHKLWVFGNNSNGELGIEHNMKSSNARISCPVLHPFFVDHRIEKICCGTQHTSVIATLDLEKNKNRNWANNGRNECYFFGRNKEGQIGNGLHGISNVSRPHLFQSLPSYLNVIIEDVSCGFLHSVVLCSVTNNVYTFGRNTYRECSINGHENLYLPYLLTKEEMGIDRGMNIKRVIAGLGTTLIIVAC